MKRWKLWVFDKTTKQYKRIHERFRYRGDAMEYAVKQGYDKFFTNEL